MTTATRLAALTAAALTPLAACAGEPSDKVPAAEIATPAGPGSGQPFLDAAGDGVWMSWTEPATGGHRVAVSFYDGEWSEPATIAEGDAFFVNWADFPSVRAFGDRLFAHWLQREGQATYDYGVRVAVSDDRGESWTEPWTPHDDGTPTEHGFVSFFGADDGVWATWLDGRAMVEPGGAMSLRARMLAGPGPPGAAPAGPETIVDDMSCECCQTDAVVADGVPVVVFRNRAPGEIRDIHVSRLLDSGWTPSSAVHDDGWVFGGCPVNGPAMVAHESLVAVAWFTAPDAEPRVNVAFSTDGAATFGPPVRVDEGRAAGRVDVVLLDDGAALVTWLEVAGGAGGASILGRRVGRDGTAGDPVTLATTEVARASGFPRIARLGSDRLMLGWTDSAGEGRVRASVFDLELWQP